MGNGELHLFEFDGAKYWTLNGEYHREDGPAMEFPNGEKRWFFKNMIHRIGGPAIERPSGNCEWYLHRQRHRIDGPAIEFTNFWMDGQNYPFYEYFLNGVQLTYEQWRYLRGGFSMSCINSSKLKHKPNIFVLSH